MYLCYIDESGTAEVPGTTSHYILAGLAIPIYKWKACEQEVNTVKARYELTEAEVHTGWLIRTYPEQNTIPNFESLSHNQRRIEVSKARRAELLKLQKSPANSSKLKQNKKELC